MMMAATTIALCGLTACGKQEQEPEKPVYESNEIYDIGMWVGV